MKEIPMLDLQLQFQSAEVAIRAAIERVIETQQWILGPEVSALELEIAQLCGTKYAVAVSSGTDALLLSLMALDISTGDEVITTPYTFFATAGSIARLGAKPVFVDINPDTYNLEESQIEAAITSATKAIMPVHLYGQCARMNEICRIAKKYNLFVIEDAAQALGSKLNNQPAGSFGDAGCFSFFPSKNLGALGDAGIITTQNDELYEKMKTLRSHGSKPKYFHKLIGGNFRMDAIHAAVLRAKLPYLNAWTEGRRKNAKWMRDKLSDLASNGHITLPAEDENGWHIYNQFVLRTEKRDELRNFLSKKSICTEIYYPVPMHLQECFAYLKLDKGSFPHSEQAALQSFAIPIYPELNADQLIHISDAIHDFFR